MDFKRGNRWTKDEDKILHDNRYLNRNQLTELIPRHTAQAIEHRRRAIGATPIINFVTPEQDEFIKAHLDWSNADIAKALNRHVSSIQKRKKILSFKTLAERRPKQSFGNSLSDNSYPGPEGWTVEKGPPCKTFDDKECAYHHDKITDQYTREFRKECRLCRAKFRWDAHNGGMPQSSDFFECIHDHYQCEEFEVGF